jgi:DNA polymerase-4
LSDLDDIRAQIEEMARAAVRWLEKKALFARTVTIKVRYHDFTTITRSQSDTPTRDEAHILRRAVALLDKTDCGRVPVRLLGVSVHNFCDTPAAAKPRVTRLPFEE